jgi:tRNA pseudouridine55 synthase
MLILIGRDYTRVAQELTGLDKVYSGRVVLGLISATDDREGLDLNAIDKIKKDLNFITDNASTLSIVDHFLLLLSGRYHQMPPQFSAKRINGQRSYMRARRGQYTQLKTKLVNINMLTYRQSNNILEFKMKVSSGTYIRSFARDMGQISGLGGYLDSLNRESIGEYNLSQATDWEQII